MGVTIADLSFHGQPDFATTNRGRAGGNYGVSAFVKSGKIYTPTTIPLPGSALTSDIKSAEFNADGRIDLATVDSRAKRASLLTTPRWHPPRCKPLP